LARRSCCLTSPGTGGPCFFGATQQAQGVELSRLTDAVRRDLGDQDADLAGGGFSQLGGGSTLSSRPSPASSHWWWCWTRSVSNGLHTGLRERWCRPCGYHLPAGTQLTLVLCGSAIGMMEAMIGAGGALRGRPTLTLRLSPIEPVPARAFLPELEPPASLKPMQRAVVTRCICGRGISTPAARSNLFAPRRRPGWNPVGGRRVVCSPRSSRTPAATRAYLHAIGRGRTRYAQIASESDQPSSTEI